MYANQMSSGGAGSTAGYCGLCRASFECPLAGRQDRSSRLALAEASAAAPPGVGRRLLSHLVLRLPGPISVAADLLSGC